MSGSIRLLSLCAWLALWLILFALILYPVSTNILRFGSLICVLALWCGALFLFWNKKLLRFILLLIVLIVATLFFLPGRASNAAAMRQAYVNSLMQYEGTRYVWGGENRFGIDCSGLVRRGLVNADFKQGILTANPGLIREASSLWWHDESASMLLAGYRKRTRDLLAVGSINELDHSLLLPGDIAVTADGLHTLAYIGDQTWIEADPGPMRVIKVRAPSDNIWFKVPVHIMRWQQFEN
ncbi:MAG: hypothetical protein AUG51_13715 [Acidobacteria bacterium 13_1_20CM_3_53_8]|nr:MAG: hypothetical protein AUG51_13715 [Acidobacteria bacterium 13_1_20CM_3_53_8]